MLKYKYLALSIILLMVLLVAAPSLSVLASSLAATAPGLGTAESFAVLAGGGITNTGPTTITGDVGTFATTSETGFSTVTLLDGVNHAGDSVTQGAKTALVTAYNSAAGQGPTTAITGDLGGLILQPGVYNSASSVGLTGTLTLDGLNDPNSVFIFQVGSALTTASGSRVSLINGAQACNVYWQVFSAATLGTGSSFIGTIMTSQEAIVDDGGSTINGRLLASVAAVTLNNTTISRPFCTVPPSGQTRRIKLTAQARGIQGLPNTGGAPIRSENTPWSLVIVAGLGTIALVLGVQSYIRSHLPKQ